MMSAALSDCGNTRLPRSVLSGNAMDLEKRPSRPPDRMPPSAEYRKRGLTGTLLQNLLHIAVIAHVAAALARDKQLAANFFVGFQQRHLRALLRGSACRHQTGCAAADYDNVQFISSSGFSYTSYSSQMRSSLLNVCSISSRRLMPTATISALMTDKGATSESTKLAISLRASST